MENLKSFCYRIGTEIHSICESLDNSIECSSANFYIEVNKIADEIRKFVNLDCNQIPVNIEGIAEAIGIKVSNLPLTYHYEKGKRRITILHIGKEPVIFIDSSASESELRYAVAFEIGYFMSMKGVSKENTYTVPPNIPTSSLDLVLDALSISLLVPFESFCDELNNYVSECNKQKCFICMEDFMRYFSDKIGIPSYNMAVAYQQLRFIALKKA